MERRERGEEGEGEGEDPKRGGRFGGGVEKVEEELSRQVIQYVSRDLQWSAAKTMTRSMSW